VGLGHFLTPETPERRSELIGNEARKHPSLPPPSPPPPQGSVTTGEGRSMTAADHVTAASSSDVMLSQWASVGAGCNNSNGSNNSQSGVVSAASTAPVSQPLVVGAFVGVSGGSDGVGGSVQTGGGCVDGESLYAGYDSARASYFIPSGKSIWHNIILYSFSYIIFRAKQ
jgi:hypothetical protein